MIGTLTFRYGRRIATAQLRDDLHWASEDEDVAEYLNDVCALPEPVFNHEDAGRRWLLQAGERLGARVELAERASVSVR